jgi:tRNA threonylcarbamoyladenosine biosynthesis protein TsaB
MRILAVDTATKSCSVAVTENDTVLGEVTAVSEQTHSKHLLDMVHAVIREAGLTLSALDGFAVTRGPGSFTGLRIGISSVKGLALATNKPVVGISSLETLAQQVTPTSELICPLIDARKGQIYTSLYRYGSRGLSRQLEERVLAPQEGLHNIDERCVFVGSGAVLYRGVIADKLGDLACFATREQHIIQATTLANLALKRFEKGDAGQVDDLVPRYIRKSDAELNFTKNRKKIPRQV